MDKIRVLVVDDEPFNLDLIEAAFALVDNIEITNAGDAFQALGLMAENDYDVVLLDISMPRLNGIEVLEKIREDEYRSRK